MGNVYRDRLQWKRDPLDRKIIKTTLVKEDDFSADKALTAAVKKRKYLIAAKLTSLLHTNYFRQPRLLHDNHFRHNMYLFILKAGGFS